MIELLLVLLVAAWFFGYIQIPGLVIPKIDLFVFNGRTITLFDALIFLLIVWAIGVLPSPFRQIAGVFFILWILSTFGVIAIAGLANLLVIAIIIGVVASIFSHSR